MAGPPVAVKKGDLAVTSEGSVLGRIMAVEDVHEFSSVTVHAQNNAVVDVMSARLDELAKGQTISDVMQEVVAALVAEVNRLEADLARERGEKDLVLLKYIELATKVADHVAGVEKPAAVPGFTESTCHRTPVT